MTKPIVFVPEPIATAGMDILAEHCEIIAPWQHGDDAGEIPPQADAALVRIYTVDESRLAAAPNLRVVGKHGVGLDNIDIAAATQRKIAIVWTPEANADAVAQHALSLILGLSNRIKTADAALRQGHFNDRMQFSSLELRGRTLGIIGLGRIGSRVAKKAALGLDMEVLAYDPYVDRPTYNGPAAFVDELEDLLARADFVTLHVPLTDETRNMINAERMAQMKDGAYLINTSRGAAVDEAALATALQSSHLAGAGIDVFATEPPHLEHPLQKAPNTLLTPHVAGLSDRALVQVATQAAQGIVDVLQGRRPQSPVNPEVFD
ncbi:MAG: D-3-phosphoglycerate dehydrogenase [Candidatus Latescibacterota bacterium]